MSKSTIGSDVDFLQEAVTLAAMELAGPGVLVRWRAHKPYWLLQFLATQHPGREFRELPEELAIAFARRAALRAINSTLIELQPAWCN